MIGQDGREMKPSPYVVETDAEKIKKLEDRINLLGRVITAEMTRVDTLRDMLIDAIKHQRIEKLEERIEKLEQLRKADRKILIDGSGIQPV